MFTTQVVPDGSGQVAGLAPVVEPLYVDDPAVGQGEVDRGAAQLGQESGQLDASDVVAGKVGIAQEAD
jgi:hypothetical protein